MLVVDKLKPRHFTAILHDGGVALCTDQSGAFLCLKFAEELEELRALLDSFDVRNLSREGERSDG